MSDQSNYKVKYLKYKNKYLSLKTQIGAGNEPTIDAKSLAEGTIKLGKDNITYYIVTKGLFGLKWEKYSPIWPPVNINNAQIGDIVQGQGQD
jgi:hypothetical protein